MVKFTDHNGITTFNDSVKTWSYAELERVFAGKHDLKLLAKALGIRVEKKGDSKPQDAEVKAYVPKKKKED